MTGEGEFDSGDDAARALVGEFALGLLEGAERADAVRRIGTEPALRHEYRGWITQLSGLDENFAEVPPPVAALARIEARLFGTEAPARRGWWESLAVWRGLAAGALAVAVLAVGFGLLRSQAPGGHDMVAAIGGPEGGVAYVALYDADRAMLHVTPIARPDATGKDIELWAINGDAAPVSLGVLPVTGGGDMPMPRGLDFTAGTVLAISLEPAGGSPTGQPTGPVLGTGAATLA